MESIEINDFNLLAAQVKDGSPLAYKKLFDALWEPLFRHTQCIVMDEHEAKDILQSLAAKVGSSVSAKTSQVVAGPGAGSKLSKAKSYNISVMNEEQFVTFLKDYR